MDTPKQNITLDFTMNNAVNIAMKDQELAIMPASLAKKLLKDYSTKLVSSSNYNIIKPLIRALDTVISNGTVQQAVEECINFIQERTLIDACAKEDWNVFSTAPKLIPVPDACEVVDDTRGCLEDLRIA